MTISTVSSRKEQQPRDTIEVVIDMVRPERIRQSQYPVPRWWLDAAISAFRASGLGQVEGAVALSRAINRTPIWNHSTVSKFLAGKYVTEELVNAFAALFDLPLPAYHPRDMREALAMKAAADSSTIAQVARADAKRDERLASVDRGVAALRTRRQGDALFSEHGDKDEPRSRGSLPPRAHSRRA